MADLHAADCDFPAFAVAASDSGLRAAFSFPVLLGRRPLGTLDLYRTRAGELTHDQFADAQAAAVLVTRLLTGTLHAGGATADPDDLSIQQHYSALRQAAAYLAAQHAADPWEMSARLRARAFATGRIRHRARARGPGRPLDTSRRDLALTAAAASRTCLTHLLRLGPAGHRQPTGPLRCATAIDSRYR